MGEGERRFMRERIYVYLWLIYIVIWQKPTKYCKAISVKVKVLVSQSCLTLQSLDCSLPGSTVHGILQARILEWVAIKNN